jgi:hypothetical protein
MKTAQILKTSTQLKDLSWLSPRMFWIASLSQQCPMQTLVSFPNKEIKWMMNSRTCLKSSFSSNKFNSNRMLSSRIPNLLRTRSKWWLNYKVTSTWRWHKDRPLSSRIAPSRHRHLDRVQTFSSVRVVLKSVPIQLRILQ